MMQLQLKSLFCRCPPLVALSKSTKAHHSDRMVAAEVCAALSRISAKVISAGQGCARVTTLPWIALYAQPERLWALAPALAQEAREAVGGLQNLPWEGWQKRAPW